MDASQLKSIVALAEDSFDKGDPQTKLMAAQILIQVEQLKGINAIAKQMNGMKTQLEEGFGDLLDSIENRLWPLVVEWDVEKQREREAEDAKAEEARKKSPFDEEREDEQGDTAGVPGSG